MTSNMSISPLKKEAHLLEFATYFEFRCHNNDLPQTYRQRGADSLEFASYFHSTVTITTCMEGIGKEMMKDQTIITFAILSFTMVVPSANAATDSVVTNTEEPAPITRVYTSMKVEAAPSIEASDAPIFMDSLKKDEIIEQHKHRHLRSAVEHGDLL